MIDKHLHTTLELLCSGNASIIEKKSIRNVDYDHSVHCILTMIVMRYDVHI